MRIVIFPLRAHLIARMNSKYLIATLALCLPIAAQSQITFDHGNSSWGASGTFTAVGGDTGSTTSATPAFYSGAHVSGVYTFGFANTAAPTGTSDFNLSSTVLPATTALTLTFSNVTAAPNYIAITGGDITAYNYNATTDKLTLTTSTVDPVASASDTDGTALGSAFGLILDYGGSNDLSGTVFQTNMYWGDVASVASDYSGDTPIASVNADGFDGIAATFIAHLSLEFLQANGINSPSDCIALVQKAGGNYNITIIREVHAGANAFDDVGYTYIGASTFDLDGSGNDDYVKATYSNSVWSDGNIGITAVPEPSTYALILGALSLAGIAIRRRHRS